LFVRGDVMTAEGPSQAAGWRTYSAVQRGIPDFGIGEAAASAIIIFAVSAVIITLFLKYMKRVMKAQAIA